MGDLILPIISYLHIMQPITFSLIQTNLHWEDKAANLSMLEEKIKQRQEHTEIVILPEMFTTGFSMNPSAFAENMEDETVKWMQRIAAEEKIILMGSIIIGEENKFYNRLIWMLPNGQYGKYDKRHLFGFAKEDQHYSAGNKRLIAQAKGWKINVQVCYDLRFPIWARQQPTENGDAEFDILIYVANWPERRSHAWKTLLCARAIENQCYVIGVNRVGDDGNNIYHSGNSMVVDPLGQVLYHKADEEDIFTITLNKEKLNEVRERFPFLKDADNFSINNEK
jgi:omega-amidase